MLKTILALVGMILLSGCHGKHPPAGRLQGQNVGNGGDFIRGFFEQGRIHAVNVVERITEAHFLRNSGSRLTRAEIEWLLHNKSVLKADLAEANHIWEARLPRDLCPFHNANTCACTSPFPMRNIYFSYENCRPGSSLAEVGQLLLHETLHHWLGTDEEKVYRTAAGVYSAWLASAHNQVPRIILNEHFPAFASEPGREHLLRSAASAWTGKRLVVWNPLLSQTAHFYDPASGTWTQREVQPRLPWTSASFVNETLFAPLASVWTGERLVIFFPDLGHAPWNRYPMAGLVYDPESNRWSAITKIGAPPYSRLVETERFTPSSGIKHVIAAGKKAIVFGGGDPESRIEPGGIYDPLTDQWEEISYVKASEGERYQSMVWASDRLVLWGRFQKDYVWVRAEGLIYDPLLKTWTEIPSPPRFAQTFPGFLENFETEVSEGLPFLSLTIPSPQFPEYLSDSVVQSDGHSLFIYGGWANRGLVVGFEKVGAILNPVHRTWSELELSQSPLPYDTLRGAWARPSFLSTWDGLRHIVFGRDLNYYSPQDKRWSRANGDIEQFGLEARTLSWTGLELILWDGVRRGLVFVP